MSAALPWIATAGFLFSIAWPCWRMHRAVKRLEAALDQLEADWAEEEARQS